MAAGLPGGFSISRVLRSTRLRNYGGAVMSGFAESNTNEAGQKASRKGLAHVSFCNRLLDPRAWRRAFPSSFLSLFFAPVRPLAFIFFLPIALMFIPGAAYSAVVILEWSANPEPDLDGYIVYYGTSGRNYAWSVDVGNYTTCAISDSRFEDGQTYYFAATAYDGYGNESGYSDEVTYTFSAADTDGDGIADYDEINKYSTDPDKMDSDADGLNDGDELAYWGEDWDADYDDDGLINLLDKDSDGDGQWDGTEYRRGCDPSDPTSTATGMMPSAAMQLILGHL